MWGCDEVRGVWVGVEGARCRLGDEKKCWSGDRVDYLYEERDGVGNKVNKCSMF